LFFGNSSDFQELAKQIPATAKCLIIRMGKVPYLDQSGLYAFEELLLRNNTQNIKTLFVKLQEQPKVLMGNIDIIPDLVPEENLFDSFKEAMAYVREHVVDEG
ncbi:MAG: STAS domain-containing protein, partial [Marinirhabdus sp.]